MAKRLIDELLSVAPALAPLYREHMADNGALLPSVLMEDFTRWFLDETRHRDGREQLPSQVDRFLTVLDGALARGDDDLCNLIGVAFTEALWAQPPSARAGLRRLLPERLQDDLEAMEAWYRDRLPADPAQDRRPQ